MTQREALDLLEQATADLPLDLDSIVAGGVRRGRIRRRNRRVGTTIALAAVAGVVSLGAAVLPLGGGGGGGGELAVEPTVGPSQTTAAPPTVPAPRVFSASGNDFPAIVAGLAGISDVEGPLMAAGYGVADGPDTWGAFFRLNGALTSVYVQTIDPARAWRFCARSAENCRSLGDGWIGSRLGAPQDGVTANFATLWSDRYELTVTSYNAAEAKESPVLSERPQLSAEQLEQMVLDPVWFSSAPTPGASPAATAPSGP